jgi:hypothetical protein
LTGVDGVGIFGDFSPLGQEGYGTAFFEQLHIERQCRGAADEGGALLRENVGDVDDENHVNANLRDAARVVMMSDGFHQAIGQAPQTEEVRAHFGMRNGREAFLDFVERLAFFLGLNEDASEVRGSAFGDDELADIVKQGGKDDGGIDLGALGDAGGNAAESCAWL